MLKIENLNAGYGAGLVLQGVDFSARAGEVSCLMGRNGAGKSTLMQAIIGVLPAKSGRVLLEGRDLCALPAHRVPLQGIAWVPQGRRLFGPMSVAENLKMGGLARGNSANVLQDVLDMFPRLAERYHQQASTLSGGEQQMLAIGRALCLEPKVLLLDEPTEGLQPSMIAMIQNAVLTLKARGVAVVLVEQRLDAVLKLADQVSFMAHGRVAETMAAADLTPSSPQLRDYVGL